MRQKGDLKAENTRPVKSSSTMAIAFVACLAILGLLFGKTSNASNQLQTQQLMDVSLQMPGQSSMYYQNPLGIPPGEAQALPSILVTEADPDAAVKRGQYGGKGDKKHLGGFTKYDGQGVSPELWKHMITNFGIKSVMDVGCGKGISTLWFHLHGAKVLCLEGSHDAVEHTLLPDPATQVVEHDFARGPYWPKDTYDAVWCVEFLEHVGRNYQYNYIQAWRKAALIFATHSNWGGWHHVEVHKDDWWIVRMESFGFRYSAELTKQVRKIASEDRNPDGPDGQPYNAQHLWMSMLVFINPMVASLPEHNHLFAEDGCYYDYSPAGQIVHQKCGLRDHESTMPPSYQPLNITAAQDKAWMDAVKAHIASQPDPTQ